MIMDWKEAKALSLEVWDFFRNHPECTYKKDLPIKLWNKIRLMKGYYLLCEYFNGDCSNCPLRFCYDVYGNFGLWKQSITAEYRKKHANILYKKIKKWNPEKKI